MKKLFLSLFVGMLILSSCENENAVMSDVVVVQQINVLEGKNYKYEVIFKGSSVTKSSLLTNLRYQVDDTLFGFHEFFEGKTEQTRAISRERDSLAKELNTTKYFLGIMKEKFLKDSTRRK